MSTPKNKIAETIHAVEGVVKAIPVYEDVVQPAAKEVGTALQTVTKCVNVALAPISALVWGYDKIKKFVDTSVSERLSRIPADQIVTPKPEVAGPALEALRYAGHDNDLRDLFANLLAAAMDSESASKAHPGFVEVIKNLSPDEARIMRLFATVRSRPAVSIRRRITKNPNDYMEILKNYSLVGTEAGCMVPTLTTSYIDNLCRLKLLDIDDKSQLATPGTYDPLETSEELKPMKEKIEKEGDHIFFSRRVIEITVWGRQFCDACVIAK